MKEKIRTLKSLYAMYAYSSGNETKDKIHNIGILKKPKADMTSPMQNVH